MAIEFDCPYCTTSIRVPDAANGKKGKCPRCEKIVRVPKIEIPTTAPAEPPPPPNDPPPVPDTNSDDAAPPRPAWLGGTPPEEQDPSGFVEAAPDGPPQFAAFDADEDETRQLDRSELEAAAPTANDGIGEIPSFDEPAVGPPGTPPQGGASPGRRVVRRRRRKKKVPPWAIPVACIAVMGGLLAWWMFRSQPKLEGELSAEAYGFLRPAPKLLDAASAGIDNTEMSLVAEALGEISSIKSDFIRIDLRGHRGAIEVRPVETRQTRFVKLIKKSNADLARYLKDMPDQLDEIRLKQLKSAARALVNKVGRDGVAVDGTNNRTVRDDLALAVVTGPLGFHLAARYDNREFPCCYEDAEGVYFLMPLAAERFRVEGREVNGRVAFSGEYVVNGVTIIEGERPAEYSDPWQNGPAGGPDPGPGDSAPPLSESR